MSNFSHDAIARVFGIVNHKISSIVADKDLFVVDVENDKTTKKYYLVKVHDSAAISEEKSSPVVLKAVCTVQDTLHNNFFVFPKEAIHVDVLENNLGHLHLVLDNLVKFQVQDLRPSRNPGKINVSISNLHLPKQLRTEKVTTELEKLQKRIDGFQSDTLVRSLGGYARNNVFIIENRAVFLDASSNNFISPIQDALWYIFINTTEEFRQKHFKELITFYFESFLKHLTPEIALKFPEDYREYLVRTLLPVVKLNVASVLQEQTSDELLNNINNFFENPLINQEDIYEILENKLHNSYELLHYNLRALSETNGHLGQYYHLDFSVRVENEVKEITLFAKFIIPPTEAMGLFVKSGPAYKEHFFYSILLPLYRKNGLESLLDFAPRCYLSQVGWLIVLDDISTEGYTSFQPNKMLDYQGLSAVIEKLAKFHASSIIYEEIVTQRDGHPYCLAKDFQTALDSTFFVYNDASPLKTVFHVSKDGVKYLFELFSDITESFHLSLDQVEQFLLNTLTNSVTIILPSDKHRNAIVHGDMYIGNILLKFDENHHSSKAKLVDFQMLKYCPPAADLVFFIYANSNRDTRKQYLNKLTEDYYRHISNHISDFGFNPETVYCRKDFEDSLEYVKVASVVTATEYNHIIKIDPNCREELFHDEEQFDYYMHKNRRGLIDNNISNESYRLNLRELVEDLAELIATKKF